MLMRPSIVLLPMRRPAISSRPTLLSRIGNAMTYSRIPLGILVFVFAIEGTWSYAGGFLAGFALLDILDGRFARAGGAQDTAERRIVDAITDKITAHLCFMTIWIQMSSIVWFWFLILVRDCIQGSASMCLIRQERVVAAGAGWHRFFTLLEIIWMCSLYFTSSNSLMLMIVVLLLGTATLIDYVSQATQVLRKRAPVMTV